MQWNNQKNAGFSSANSTWLPVNNDVENRNVLQQKNEKTSLLNVYQTLNRLRKENNAIHSGNIEIINTGNKNILAFLRTCEDEKLLVLLNFSKSKITNNISQPIKEVVFSITNKKTFDGILDGFDGVILKI